MSHANAIPLQNLAPPASGTSTVTSQPCPSHNAPSPSPVQHPANPPPPGAVNAPVSRNPHNSHSLYDRLRSWVVSNAHCTVFGTLLAFLSLVAALIGLVSGFQALLYGKLSTELARQSLELDKWQAKAGFRVSCQDQMVRQRHRSERS
jgi:hypothetical protein